jgi:hypothetical protein
MRATIASVLFAVGFALAGVGPGFSLTGQNSDAVGARADGVSGGGIATPLLGEARKDSLPPPLQLALKGAGKKSDKRKAYYNALKTAPDHDAAMLQLQHLRTMDKSERKALKKKCKAEGLEGTSFECAKWRAKRIDKQRRKGRSGASS